MDVGNQSTRRRRQRGHGASSTPVAKMVRSLVTLHQQEAEYGDYDKDGHEEGDPIRDRTTRAFRVQGRSRVPGSGAKVNSASRVWLTRESCIARVRPKQTYRQPNNRFLSPDTSQTL